MQRLVNTGLSLHPGRGWAVAYFNGMAETTPVDASRQHRKSISNPLQIDLDHYG